MRTEKETRKNEKPKRIRLTIAQLLITQCGDNKSPKRSAVLVYEEWQRGRRQEKVICGEWIGGRAIGRLRAALSRNVTLGVSLVESRGQKEATIE